MAGYILCFLVSLLCLVDAFLPASGRPVHKAFAIGDSYTANPGAGKKLKGKQNQKCSRFSQNWVRQAEDSKVLTPADPNEGNPPFQNLACTGALTHEIMEQIDDVDGVAEVITITAGGNNVGFGAIVADCIYGVGPNTEQACQNAMDSANSVLSSAHLFNNLKNLLQFLRNKRPNDSIFWLGYAKFFNEDTTQCNTICFQSPAIFANPCKNFRKLTHEHRHALNQLVVRLNDIIQNVIHSVHETGLGEHKYVGVDAMFEGHRFCEPGVTEPDTHNDNTFFYPATKRKRNFDDAINAEDFDPSMCDDKKAVAGDIGKALVCGYYNLKTNAPHLLVPDDDGQNATIDGDVEGNFKKNIMQRTFHPTKFGAQTYTEQFFAAYIAN